MTVRYPCILSLPLLRSNPSSDLHLYSPGAQQQRIASVQVQTTFGDENPFAVIMNAYSGSKIVSPMRSGTFKVVSQLPSSFFTKYLDPNRLEGVPSRGTLASKYLKSLRTQSCSPLESMWEDQMEGKKYKQNHAKKQDVPPQGLARKKKIKKIKDIQKAGDKLAKALRVLK